MKEGEMGVAINGDIKGGGDIVLHFNRVENELLLWFRLKDHGPVIEVKIPDSEARDLRNWMAEMTP